jgi:hypothetical protein
LSTQYDNARGANDIALARLVSRSLAGEGFLLALLFCKGMVSPAKGGEIDLGFKVNV